MKAWSLGLLWVSACAARAEASAPASPREDALTYVGADVEAPPAATSHATTRHAADSRPAADEDEDEDCDSSRGHCAGVAPALYRALALTDVPPPLLFLPAGNAPVPLVIAAHGAGGSPEWDCEWLTHLTRGQAALLCLRGLALARGQAAFYYPEHHSLGRWLDAALSRTQTDYATRLDGTFIYVGYSQGATMGALAVQTHPTPVPHLILVEGGLDGWNQSRAAQFQRRGGRSVTFACGTRSCDAKARRLQSLLERVGLTVQVHHALGAGHTPLGEVSDFVQQRLHELIGVRPSSATQL